MDKLKDLLMKLLDVNKELDACIQGLCDWYEKERSPHPPVEPIPDIAPIIPPTAPVPDSLFSVPEPVGPEDLKPATIVYDQEPADSATLSWGTVTYS